MRPYLSLSGFFFAFLSVVALLPSCTVSVNGAPCVTDQNCPNGQYCGSEGLCHKGVNPGFDGSVPDGGDGGNDGGPGLDGGDGGPKTDGGDGGPIGDGGWNCSVSNQCNQDAGSHVCFDGGCVPGDCTGNTDCKEDGKPTCGADHYCNDVCDADAGSPCGKGFRCCNGHCKAGDCCGDPDCPIGKCVGSYCVTSCLDPSDCKSNLCCDGTCAIPLKGCCKTEDCVDSDYGLRCDYNVCKCTEDSECKSNMICDKTNLQCKVGCSATHPCSNAGDKCCDSLCHTGDCCKDQDCKQAGLPTCNNFNCSSACNPVDDQCGLGWKCCTSGDAGYSCTTAYCCNNADCKDPDKPYCDTGSKTPQCINKCGPDAGGVACGAGYVCCDGTCYQGNCCKTVPDCSIGKCINHNCAKDCTEADGGGYCGAGEPKCCITGPNKGRCYNGACCDNSQCTADPNGKVCLSDFSCGCTVKGDCAGGQVCYNGKCLNGDCVGSADCTDPAKPICGADHYCKACTGDSSCIDSGKGNICCSGHCLKGSCCTSASPTEDDCEEFVEKPVCDETTLDCRGCINNLDCSNHALDPKCCTTDSSPVKGDCYSGECCSSFNCTSVSELTKTPICNLINRTCNACLSDYECQTDLNNPALKCCKTDGLAIKGACYSGACCDDAQCSNPTKYCHPKLLKCVQCVENADCSGGITPEVCCSGQCIKGNCCIDKDCPGSSIDTNVTCYQNHCRLHCDNINKCPTSGGTSCCNNLMPPLPVPFPMCSPTGKCCPNGNECNLVALEKCCFGICISDLATCQ